MAYKNTAQAKKDAYVVAANRIARFAEDIEKDVKTGRVDAGEKYLAIALKEIAESLEARAMKMRDHKHED